MEKSPNHKQQFHMKRKILQINAIIFVALMFSCNKSIDNYVVKNGASIWRIVQITERRNDSSNYYYEFNRFHTYEELYCENKKMKRINSNPDIKGFRKWELVNDSIVKIAYLIKY